MTNKTITLFGLNIDRKMLPEAVESIINAAKIGRKGIVVTPNVDHIVKLSKDSEFRSAYSKAINTFADGMPIVWLSKLLYGDEGLPQRVTGADLAPIVCKRCADENIKIFLAGGREGAVEKAKSNLEMDYPSIEIVGTYCPPIGFELNCSMTDDFISCINASGADLMIFGVGAPKQELWADKHLSDLNIGPILCCGAAIEFMAGMVSRSPKFVSAIGMEWFWRLCKEPKRLWKRYLIDDMYFFWLVIMELFKNLRFTKKHEK